MRILLATDGSEATTRAARFIAPFLTNGDSDVRVLVVLSYGQHPYGAFGSDERTGREAAVKTKVDQLAKGVVEAFPASSDHVTVRRRFGYPPDEIALEIADWEPDLVVMGRRGVRGPSRWLGSVSEHVLHGTKVPVLLVP